MHKGGQKVTPSLWTKQKHAEVKGHTSVTNSSWFKLLLQVLSPPVELDEARDWMRKRKQSSEFPTAEQRQRSSMNQVNHSVIKKTHRNRRSAQTRSSPDMKHGRLNVLLSADIRKNNLLHLCHHTHTVAAVTALSESSVFRFHWVIKVIKIQITSEYPTKTTCFISLVGLNLFIIIMSLNSCGYLLV